jgi:hypothetical protein
LEEDIKRLQSSIATTTAYIDQLESFLFDHIDRIKYLVPAIEREEVDEESLLDEDQNLLSGIMAYGFAQLVIKQANIVVEISNEE